MSEPDETRILTPKEMLDRAKAARPWMTWLILRSRQLAFAVTMLVLLIVVLLTGVAETPPPR